MDATSARDANKDKALDAALSQIERQFGKGAMMRLGDTPQVRIPSISTGSLGLDVALGIGGLPRGRIVEIYGPESSGKTTLTLHVVANAHRRQRLAALLALYRVEVSRLVGEVAVSHRRARARRQVLMARRQLPARRQLDGARAPRALPGRGRLCHSGRRRARRRARRWQSAVLLQKSGSPGDSVCDVMASIVSPHTGAASACGEMGGCISSVKRTFVYEEEKKR